MWVDVRVSLLGIGARLDESEEWNVTLDQWKTILSWRSAALARGIFMRPFFRQLDEPSTSRMMNWNMVRWGDELLRIQRGGKNA